MRIADDPSAAPFELFEPVHRSAPFVFNAPHSGILYPRDLLQRTRLDRLTLRRSEDTFVDELFAGVTRLGAPLLKATFPRVYVDVNRHEDELDPTMFDGPLPGGPQSASARVAGGLGVIARVVGEQQEVYGAPLPAGEAQYRLDTFYRPYHRALAATVEATVAHFGTCVLVDCHSMPSGAVRAADERARRADIVLGDRFGTSCAPELTDELQRVLRRSGFAVARNRPYAGGFITERYGLPPKVHAVQIEINRALYMDEEAFARAPGFAGVRGALESACAALIEWFARTRSGETGTMAAE